MSLDRTGPCCSGTSLIPNHKMQFTPSPSDTNIPKICRILVPVNFTDLCATAIRRAQSLLPDGGTIRLLHVCDEPTHGINPLVASSVYFGHCLETAHEKSDADEKLQEWSAMGSENPKVTITTEVRAKNDIADAICEAAEFFDADVVCMATKGHSRTGVALLGSTVQSVLCRIHKPVFIITPPGVEKSDSPPMGVWTPHEMPL